MTAVDEFTTVDDADTATHDFKRDQWGRPKIKQPDGKHKGYTRCSSAAKTIEDTFNLEKWARRNVAYGLAHDSSLVARVLAVGGEPSTWQKPDKDEINAVVNAAENVAKAHKAADIGTAVHRLTDRLDRGENVRGGPYQADLDAYRKALAAAGLTVDPRYIECRIVNDNLEMAGTADRILKADRYVIADLKTSATINWGGLGWAAQLAAYAGGDLYDVDTEERVDTPDMDRQVGLIIHLPAGQGVCTIYEVDINAGLEAARLANQIRATRKASKTWITPHVKAIATPVETNQEASCPTTTTQSTTSETTTSSWSEDARSSSSPVGSTTTPEPTPSTSEPRTSSTTSKPPSGGNVDPDRRTALLARYRLFNDDDKRRYLALNVNHDDLDAVEKALDAVDPFLAPYPPAPPPPAATPPPARAEPPDEGAPVDDNDFLALSIAYARLDTPAQAWLKALIVAGAEAGVDWRAQHHHTVRRFELYRGLIALAAAGPDWGNNDTVSDIIERHHTPDYTTPAGAQLGHLNATQAANFAEQVDQYLALQHSA